MKDGVNVLGGFAKTGNPDNKLDGVNREYNFGKTRAFHGVQGISGFLPSYNLDSIH